YIHRQRDDERLATLDRQRYQTVFARHAGSVAAPTAGLHFTPELIEQLSASGVKLAYITLHVGLGTFRPITSEKVEDHDIHAEWYRLGQADAATINQARDAGGRIIPVGTTAVRTLESCTHEGRVHAGSGWTKLFIYPGCEFQIADGMVTNFHLPKSSLLALVCALAGVEHVLSAYACAVEQQYRFYSYGDAMLII
ncbi:MAG: S-adenosylmethionine:tRNA ribosyltransferase-isomerase, partial [Sedimentisphaerales bacterium]|nr:S-adenosylmethionine:tRNA ribosyltransferase-isomerase [Sedimentisphaerales bacterium]